MADKKKKPVELEKQDSAEAAKALEKAKKENEKHSKKIEAAKNPKRSFFQWFREARAEFKKVTWPTPRQTAKNTSIVLLMLTIAGISVWGLDQLLGFLMKLAIGAEI